MAELIPHIKIPKTGEPLQIHIAPEAELMFPNDAIPYDEISTVEDVLGIVRNLRDARERLSEVQSALCTLEDRMRRFRLSAEEMIRDSSVIGSDQYKYVVDKFIRPICDYLKTQDVIEELASKERAKRLTTR